MTSTLWSKRLRSGTDLHNKNILFFSYLNSFVELVCHCVTDHNTRVRNAALFALGQFSEHLQVGGI